MSTVEGLLNVARNEIGYYAPSDPEIGSKYARWYVNSVSPPDTWLLGPSTQIWWCCMFASWCLAMSGTPCAGFPSYNTDLALKSAHVVPYAQIRPGDFVIFDWNRDGATDHIGIAEKVGDYQLITIEGNYNNSVARVDRTNSTNYIAAVVRPNYDEDEPHVVTGIWDKPTVSALQRWLRDEDYYNGEIDGTFDSGYSLTIAAIQRYLVDADYL